MSILTKTAVTLDKVEIKQKVKITRITKPEIAKRLFAMGLLPGTELEIIKKLWMNSSFYILTNNQIIALRKNEAKAIEVL